MTSKNVFIVCNPLLIEFWIGILSEMEIAAQILDGVSSAEGGTAASRAFAVLFAAKVLPKWNIHPRPLGSWRRRGCRNSLDACARELEGLLVRGSSTLPVTDKVSL